MSERILASYLIETAYPLADAAAALDIPLGTLRSRLFRARRQLQEDLMAFAKDAGYSVTASVPGERKGGTRAG